MAKQIKSSTPSCVITFGNYNLWKTVDEERGKIEQEFSKLKDKGLEQA